ncbi:hypothetical protein Z043_113111 [Scleropages formosus]|uniref:FH2 domain-containing protein n=1 Tax=Scleropages formosus TaxID=113540 RepID=A0A0P7YKW7_SCLFO|nr:hypothetical protein Z043_113111 [Scleropages formosus]
MQDEDRAEQRPPFKETFRHPCAALSLLSPVPVPPALPATAEASVMHVMNSSTPVNQKESDVGDENVVAGFMPASSNVGTPPVPPPPPPPAVPPPPPPPPGTGIPSHGLRKKRRVRSFFWKPIPEEKVRGRANIWTLSVRQQQHYQIDVRTIEELFGQREEARDTASQGGRSSASFRETKEEITILDSKRGMNVGIFLKQFKK